MFFGISRGPLIQSIFLPDYQKQERTLLHSSFRTVWAPVFGMPMPKITPEKRLVERGAFSTFFFGQFSWKEHFVKTLS